MSGDGDRWARIRSQQDWQRQIDGIARRSRRDLEDQGRRARAQLDRSLADARLAAERRSREAEDAGRRDRDKAGAAGRRLGGGGGSVGWSQADDVALAAAIPVAALAALPLVVGHVATFVTAGDWPRYRLADAPGIVGRFLAHPGDPAAAWAPVNHGAPVPGPVAWWTTFAVLAGLVALLGVAAWNAVRTPKPAGHEWATKAEARAFRVRRGDPHRLVVGTVDREPLAVEHRHSLLVVGPAFSGKTSGITIPALLDWPGPAVVVSTKGHLIDQTIGWRSHLGEVHVFDPAGTTSYPRSGWSPLANCATWPGAIRMARDLTVAAKASIGEQVDAAGVDGIGGDALWSASMSMALAPYLYAATTSGQPVGTVIDWIAREERDEVLEALRPVGGPAIRTHETSFVRPDPDRSAFLGLMQRILSVYDDPIVAASMDRHEIVADELLDGGHHTLYLTAPEHDQARFRPLNAAVLRQVLAAAYDRSAATAAELDPPLLLLLDQVVGIAPVEDLAAVASTGAARGVQVVSVFKDLAQIDGHYGQRARLLVNNHPAKLALPRGPGTGDERDDPHLLPDHLDAELAGGEAALLYGSHRPIRLRLRPWFAVKELRRRRETPQDVWDPADHGHAAPRYVPPDQAGIWLRRGSAPRDNPAEVGAPLDRGSPEFREIFGSLHEDDTSQFNVTPLFDPRGDNPFRR